MPGRQTSRRTRITDYRLIAVGIVLVAAWAAIGLRLFQVQVVQADELAAMGITVQDTPQGMKWHRA